VTALGVLRAGGGRRGCPVAVVAVVEEHGARHPHRGHPVGERVVDAPDQCRPTALDRDHVERPQRPVARQALGHQGADERGQGVLADIARVAHLAL
jgi:hypothetical protein